ncbi:hypothetical protein [Nitratireductor pacificus]|uniref:Uncharacterized protein n=1 Tax=Nitratireductor pacificus pht-3B TaxID=391937 RepID=K2MZ38_9HYPH|nr:hypothetical protein [Nitratireductor pacificus]EKF17258.1 hypothetical protein NA2_19061 [Nitratireductor pacificus pht-3B]
MATMKTSIELTASARRKAETASVAGLLAGLAIGEWARKGDFVELAGEREAVTFLIRARRIRVAADGGQTLVFELDHPPRPAVR